MRNPKSAETDAEWWVKCGMRKECTERVNMQSRPGKQGWNMALKTCFNKNFENLKSPKKI